LIHFEIGQGLENPNIILGGLNYVGLNMGRTLYALKDEEFRCKSL